jgi:hypothetical protein
LLRGLTLGFVHGLIFCVSRLLIELSTLQVRNGVHPTRVYLEQDTFDDVQLPIIVETNIPPPPPAHPSARDAAYTIWSLMVAVNVTDPFDTIRYSIGAEIDGVKITDFNGNANNVQHVLNDLPLCAGVSG